MVNPFQHVSKNVSAWYQTAAESDCAPAIFTGLTTAILPVAVPVLFISAFFTKKK